MVCWPDAVLIMMRTKCSQMSFRVTIRREISNIMDMFLYSLLLNVQVTLVEQNVVVYHLKL